MKFENKLKFRIALFVLFLLLGISALTIVALKKFQYNENPQNLSYFLGTASGLIFVSILSLKKNLSALSNKKKMQNLFIEEKDERNLLIAYKSGYFTFVITLLSFYGFSLYLLFTDSPLYETMMSICSAILFFYLLIYLIVRKQN